MINMETAYLTKSTVFLVGNGPSLKGFDFTRLQNQTWLGMNAAYRYWQKIDIYPNFYACLDLVVGLSHADNICDLVENPKYAAIQSFLLRDNLIRAFPVLQNHPKVINFDRVFADLPSDLTTLITTGSHAALWMAQMGYEQIVLMGIDARYIENIDQAQSEPNDEMLITGKGPNPNYFFDDYQRLGDRYMKPNPIPNVHLGAWQRVSRHLGAHYPARLLNAAPGSSLDVADFIDLKSFFKGKAAINSVEDIFSASPHIENRQTRYAAPPNQSFSLAKFIDHLSPARYNLVFGDLSGLDKLKAYGWTRRDKPPNRWKLISLAPDKTPDKDIDDAGIVLTRPTSYESALRGARYLNANSQMVIIVSASGHTLRASLFPGPVASSPLAIIAYRHERFTMNALGAALKISCAPNYKRDKRRQRQLFKAVRYWRSAKHRLIHKKRA